MKNNHQYKYFLFIFTIFASFSSIRLSASEFKLQASVDKQTVYQNEEVNLSVRVYDAKGNVLAPKLPSFSGFNSFYSGRASHFTFVNGKSNSITEFNYVLVPKSAGVYTLEPISLNVDGREYQTEPIQIEVLGQQNIPQNTAPPQNTMPISPNPPSLVSAPTIPSLPPAQGEDANIFLRVNANKRIVYSNEQLLLTYSLLTRYDTRYEGFEKEPETSGFWVEEFPIGRDIEKQAETIGGRKYVRADVRKLALFPTAAGEYVIKPGSVKVSVQIEQNPSGFLDEFFNDSFFSNSGVFARRVDKVLNAQPITIVVKPLPQEGKPRNFSGAVGDFRMVSDVDKRTVNQNEPVTLKLSIEGEGSVETLAHPPIPEIPDVRIYDSDTKSEFYKSENVISGKKTFEIIFIPRSAGKLRIPALDFIFFNPKTEKYVTLKTESYEIKVNPSTTPPPALPKELGEAGMPDQKEIRSDAKDIRYIHERIKPSGNGIQSALYGTFILNVLLTILGFAYWIRQKQEDFFSGNIALKRERNARRTAEKSLKKLIKISKTSEQKEEDEFFDSAERLMNQYLADKLNLSPQGLTVQQALERLCERGVRKELLDQISKFYDTCGIMRYAKPSSFKADANEILEIIQTVIREELK